MPFLFLYLFFLKIKALKKTLLLLLLFISQFSIGQDKTLLWEISGNGLSKKSHLYGTMHINDKISYHLSDAFFTHLLAADMVGNESDPETWVDALDLMKTDENLYSYKFYSEFYKNPIKKEDVLDVFSTSNSYFNNMLSAIGGDTSDFQEDTVLDMFIYQTGRKYNKKIVGLEDVKGSIIPLMQLTNEDAKPKEENLLTLTKILKNRNFNEAMKEFYREKDIVMLDSIYKLMISKKAHDAFITTRNKIMANSIDSLAQKGSLFSAVGAAHLAGKEGIIELLRAKGYTVKPVFDVFSESGKKQKEKIETYFPNPSFKLTSSKDKMIQMPLNKNVFEELYNIGSPDFTNGGVTTIKRIPLNYFLKKNDDKYSPKSLDSLFYENIPGNILEKNYFETESYKGYDIKNKTKTGNSQHYRFYITPLEIIGVSMIGAKDYVKQFEGEVFDNIKIKSFSADWEKIKPTKGGFSVEIPAFYSCYGDTTTDVNNIEIQAYDSSEKSFFFINEKTLNVDELLEDSEFEQKQIHYEFYLQHEIDSTATNYNKETKSFESSSVLGNKKISLKTIIHGNKYYLLGAIDASEKAKTRFFTSFTIVPSQYNEETAIFTDTVTKFKIKLPKKSNDKYFSNVFRKKNEDKNTSEEKSENYTFLAQNGKQITLSYNKYGRYESKENIDSVKADFRRNFLHDYRSDTDDYNDFRFDEFSRISNIDLPYPYENTKKGVMPSTWDNYVKPKIESYEMLSESTTFDEVKKQYVLNALVSKSDSQQAVKYKAIIKEDSYYLLSTLVDKNYKSDDTFIEETYNSIESIENDSPLISIYNDKVKLFIEDAKSESDTLRFSALNSVYSLKLKEKDADQVIEFIDTFDFKDSETKALNSLLLRLGKIKSDKILPYLEKLYKNPETKTETQFSILEAISNQKTKQAYQKIGELLEYDLPISSNEYEVTSLLNHFQIDLENSKELFPKIFEYYSIKEYNYPVVDFCNTLLEANLISVKKLNSFKKMILTNAKMEYKRLRSWKEQQDARKEKEDDESEEVYDEDYYDNSDYAPTNDLVNYLGLLHHFPNDDSINQLLNKTKELDITSLNLELLRLGVVYNKISDSEIKNALSDEKTLFKMVHLLLYKNKKVNSEISDEEIAKSGVIFNNSIGEKDTIQFIEKRKIEQEGVATEYYFFEVEESADEDEVGKKNLHAIAFVLENDKINPQAYKNLDSVVLSEEDDRTKKINTMVQYSLNETHFRASFEKEEPANLNPFLMGY